MSDATSPSPSPAWTPSAAQLSPEAVDEVIRRAVDIDQARQDRVTLADLKETLAGLGIAPETVERAAAEVRAERSKLPPPGLPSPTQVAGHLIAVLIAASPGLALIAFADRIPVIAPWISAGFGWVWVSLPVVFTLDDVALWWQARRLHAGE